MLRARTTVSLPQSILKAADKRARKERRSRSEVFREAFQQYEERAQSMEKLFTYAEQKAREQGTTDEEIVEIIRELRQEEASL